MLKLSLNVSDVIPVNEEHTYVNTQSRILHGHYAFLQKFCGGASWTLDPSKEVVNCKTKHTNNKFAV